MNPSEQTTRGMVIIWKSFTIYFSSSAGKPLYHAPPCIKKNAYNKCSWDACKPSKEDSGSQHGISHAAYILCICYITHFFSWISLYRSINVY